MTRRNQTSFSIQHNFYGDCISELSGVIFPRSISLIHLDYFDFCDAKKKLDQRCADAAIIVVSDGIGMKSTFKRHGVM